MASDRATRAEDFFTRGFSCSQAVVAVFAGAYGLNREMALKIATGFGGGMARLGMTCGAVSGAFIIIGLAHGRTTLEGVEARDKTDELENLFAARFLARHPGLTCPQLLGYDIGKPEEHEKAKSQDLFRLRCPVYVRTAVEILEELLDLS